MTSYNTCPFYLKTLAYVSNIYYTIVFFHVIIEFFTIKGPLDLLTK